MKTLLHTKLTKLNLMSSSNRWKRKSDETKLESDITANQFSQTERLTWYESTVSYLPTVAGKVMSHALTALSLQNNRTCRRSPNNVARCASRGETTVSDVRPRGLLRTVILNINKCYRKLEPT